MDALLAAIGFVLTYTWWLIVPTVLFLAIQQYRKRQWVSTQRYVLLQVSVPKENDKAPVAAEQMFAALHGIRRDHRVRFFEGSMQEHIGFEIVSQHNRINFYVYAPEAQKSFVEGQVYAQYPKAQITTVGDYIKPGELTNAGMAATELTLTKKDAYPIKTFENFEDVDPLSGITAVMGDLAEDEQLWIQVLARPADDGWHKRGEAELKRLEGGGQPGFSAGGLVGSIGSFLGDLFNAATVTPPPTAAGKPAAPVATPVKVDEAVASGIREKSAKLGYEIKIRLVAIGQDQARARNRLTAAIGAFKQYNTANLNGFAAGKVQTKNDQIIKNFRGRVFMNRGPILNIEELASIFHLPNTSVETPTISWTATSKGEPPENLPVEGSEKGLSIFAETNFRNKVARFGLKLDDRRKHVYSIGKTGMGKTNMLENMVLADMASGQGLAVVDPHGDFVETVLDYVPKDRVDDVVLFNPADREYPIGFNILEEVPKDAKPLVASGVVSIFEKIYGYSWGPRLEHILRNSILALLDYPDATLVDVPRLLGDEKFRADVISHIEDPVTREFWVNEFAGYTDRLRSEAIAPIQNKVGQFLSAGTIRNVVGQKKTTIDIRKLMDDEKILLIKLSKGELGEDASGLLGAMLITKIQLAAMSRADVPAEKRRDFFLYVDEFQNFATQSFANILSEARKYGLSIAMANQYITQMPEEVRDAVFGNVGTLISFRVGAQDAQWMTREFEPVFEETDVVNLDKFHIYLKLAIDGITSPAFSAKTVPLPSPATSYRDDILRLTRQRYTSNRQVVEESIGQGIPSQIAATDEERHRRYQSYLDKERVFAEQAAAQTMPKPPPVTAQPKPSVVAPKREKMPPAKPVASKPDVPVPAPAPAKKPTQGDQEGHEDLPEDVVVRF